MSTILNMDPRPGISNFSSESYIERLQGVRGPRALPASARLEVGPTGAIPTVSVVPTSSARPKTNNAAIPYARTTPSQLDAGSIAFVETYANDFQFNAGNHPQRKKPPRSIVGRGTSSFATVKSIAQLNEHLEHLTAEDNASEIEEFVQSWKPDGIVINYDSTENSAHKQWPIVNVAVCGPTPMLNEGGHETAPPVSGENVRKHVCWLPGESSPSRLYVALVGYRISFDDPTSILVVPPKIVKTKAKYIAFSTSMLLPRGERFDGLTFVAVWRIGRILDSRLNMKFRNSGQVLVDISPTLNPFLVDTDIPTYADGRNGVADKRTYSTNTLLNTLIEGFHPQ